MFLKSEDYCIKRSANTLIRVLVITALIGMSNIPIGAAAESVSFYNAANDTGAPDEQGSSNSDHISFDYQPGPPARNTNPITQKQPEQNRAVLADQVPNPNPETRATNNENQNLRCYQVIYNHILSTNSGLGAKKADWIAKRIMGSSSKWRVHPLLATALFTQESGFNMSAISPTGAVGIAQLQPETAAYLGVNPYDPAQNIEGGIHYLSEQLNTFRNSGKWTASYAIAAYNAGPGKVQAYNGIPPYDETVNHVNRVGSILRKLQVAYSR